MRIKLQGLIRNVEKEEEIKSFSCIQSFKSRWQHRAACYELLCIVSVLPAEELQDLPGCGQIVSAPLSQTGLKSRTVKLTNRLYRAPISAHRAEDCLRFYLYALYICTFLARCTCSEAILVSIFLSNFLIINHSRWGLTQSTQFQSSLPSIFKLSSVQCHRTTFPLSVHARIAELSLLLFSFVTCIGHPPGSTDLGRPFSSEEPFHIAVINVGSQYMDFQVQAHSLSVGRWKIFLNSLAGQLEVSEPS
jgi:hypothetical protein